MTLHGVEIRVPFIKWVLHIGLNRIYYALIFGDSE